MRICSFLKFGKENHIVDSFENEYLFFSPLRHFRASQSDKFGQFDQREANTKVTQGKRLTLTIEGKVFQLHEMLKDFICQMQEYPSVIPGNVCSLYTAEMAMEDTQRAFTFDDRLFTQGTVALLIYNVSGFFDSLDQSLEHLDCGYTRGRVTYYDPRTVNGELSFLHKDEKFSYQKEYRVFLKTSGDHPIKIPIKNLQQYSKVIPVAQLQTLTIKLE